MAWAHAACAAAVEEPSSCSLDSVLDVFDRSPLKDKKRPRSLYTALAGALKSCCFEDARSGDLDGPVCASTASTSRACDTASSCDRGRATMVPCGNGRPDLLPCFLPESASPLGDAGTDASEPETEAAAGAPSYEPDWSVPPGKRVKMLDGKHLHSWTGTLLPFNSVVKVVPFDEDDPPTMAEITHAIRQLEGEGWPWLQVRRLPALKKQQPLQPPQPRQQQPPQQGQKQPQQPHHGQQAHKGQCYQQGQA